MLKKGSLKKDDSGFYYFGEYHTYWYNGVKNPDFDDYSNKILNYKKMFQGEINYFSVLLNNVLLDNENLALLCVPSHEVNKTGSNHILVKNICRQRKFIDASECLVRVVTIDKLAKGGKRSIQTHLNSIKMIDSHLLENKDIVLIDDVATSGNSLFACSMIIQKNVRNIKSLSCLVFAKTV